MRYYNAIQVSLFWILPLLIALASVRFLLLPAEIGLAHMAHQLRASPMSLYSHAAASSIALALVPIQLWPKIRDRWPALHRWTGRLYGVAVLVGGITGFLIALNALGGPVGQTGFAVLAVAWVATTGIGIWQARSRNFADHRRWMIRSSALTWAGVTLRLYLPFMIPALGTQLTFAIVAWLCWVPNLLFAEWLLRRRAEPRPA